MQKYSGLLMQFFGIWLTVVSWHDPAEGRLLRPLGIAIALIGLFLVLVSLKDELMAEMRREIKRLKGP